jgi:dipeptidyl aminopeptidase/acylaminoacyl peptidase
MSKRTVTIEDLLKFKLVGDPQISPDGKQILFGLKTIADKFKATSHLHLVDVKTQAVSQVTQGETSCGNGRWMPDSTIVFVSTRNEKISQLFHLPASGEARPLTKFTEGSIGAFKISPDGSKIAYTFREAHPDFSIAGTAARKEKGEGDAPLAFESTWYRLDGDGYFGEQRHKLFVLDLASSVSTLLNDKSAHGAYDFDWAPTSDKLAVIRSVEVDPFVTPPNDQIFILDLAGNESQLHGLPAGNKSTIKWSPKGDLLAYSGSIDLDDPWGVSNTKLYTVPLTGGAPTDLTGHQDYDLEVATLSDTKEAAFGACMFWSNEQDGLYVQVGIRGETHLGFVPLTGGVELKTSGKFGYYLGNISSHSDLISTIVGDANTIPEVAIIDGLTGKTELLTYQNQAWHNEVALGIVEEFEVTAEDGHKVHAWVMKPADFDPTQKYPGILEVHGGPHCQYGWAFFHEFQVLAAQGYVVVYSNPRGSKGYGEAHCKAIQGSWGDRDWVDIQAVREWMKLQTYIDTENLGIIGGSYGGFMTNWAIGHTHDFRAAVTDRCVSNMVSMAGNSDFPFNKDGYFKGVAWGNLEDIKELWRQSPIAYFTNAKTPTLIIHSEGDLRCNVEQGEQVFTALKQQGIEARFVRYPRSTFHGMSRNGPADLRIHRLNEIVAWWKRFLV